MITEWELYWLLKLDDIRNIIIGFGVLLLFISSAGSIISWNEMQDWRDEAVKRGKFWLRVCSLILCTSFVFIITGALCPTTKQMAMIKVIPVIANSKDV